ncbi:MFS transporter [Smaragdicoccus niigatensis]|uniref:MFS transporter n=1 Tax=Smaragdicoccus niigatensis TaxID=359359 RepID=UPI0003712BCF|nr:MFS transporter [Smaragdicoccus niigatensis]
MVAETIRVASPRGRWIVVATVLGSSIAMLDATVVNVALPQIGRDFDAGIDGLQWIVTGYTLTLAAFILLGGALGDRYGRREVFLIGTVAFAISSAACGFAPNLTTLVAARLVQGVAGALLTPGSLALLSAAIDPRDRGAAVGAWSGFGGIAAAVGPLLGGWLVDAVSWRAVFLLNIPVAALVVAITLASVPESRSAVRVTRLDIPGAAIIAIGLGTLTFGLIRASTWVTAAGIALIVAFVLVEMRSPEPLVPPRLFASRLFSVTNAVTFVVYIALSGVFFMLSLELQVVAGYSPLAAGAAALPITILMLALSSKTGDWAQNHGARIPMVFGPLIAAAGLLLLLRTGPHANYLLDVLPGVIVFGIGLSVLVAPLTSTVLGSVSTDDAGIASGVNNAVARTSGLIAVAALPAVVGLRGAGLSDADKFDAGFTTAMWICAGLLAAGALAATLIEKPEKSAKAAEVAHCSHCDVGAPLLASQSGE